MAVSINLNADMAEGFGAYDIGHDAEILKLVKSANIAGGMHPGAPTLVQRLVKRAVEAGVRTGAHPRFNDVWGFGRRRMDLRPDGLEYLTAYQIGALQALASYAAARVTHVKPHGALNNM